METLRRKFPGKFLSHVCSRCRSRIVEVPVRLLVRAFRAPGGMSGVKKISQHLVFITKAPMVDDCRPSAFCPIAAVRRATQDRKVVV